jgi:ankyrin repeat protein
MDDETSTMPHPNVMEQYACLVILQASNKVMGSSDPRHVVCRLGRFFAPGTGSIFYKDQSPTVQASLETLLSAAVEDGNIQLVRELLNAGTPPDVTDAPGGGWGRTVLHDAVKKQYLEVVQLLLRVGADPNAGSSLRERTALQVAASYGNYALVRLLLDYKADPNATYTRTGTALQLAVSSLCSDTASLILNAGADVNAYGCYPKVTALHVAAGTGWLELVEILLDAGADVNALGDVPKTTALHLVAERRRLDLVDILLAKGAIAHDERCPEPAVIAAARASRAVVVRRLLEFPAVGNTAQLAVQHFIRTALSAAVRSGRAEDVDQLSTEAVKAGALEYKHRASLLLKAASRSPIEVVQLLLNARCDSNAPPITSRRLTPLQAAASQNTVAGVRLLLEHGAAINAPAAASRGRTALQAAIQHENPGMVQFLLDAGADPNAGAARRHGITALEGAVMKGDIGSVISLWSHGVDINAPDLPESGMTPLAFAAAGGNAEMTQLLLNLGANPNYPVRQYRESRTPIQVTAEKGHADIVRMLLAGGADVNAPAASVGGVTALQAAAGYGDIKLVRLLLDNSADANALPQTAMESLR